MKVAIDYDDTYTLNRSVWAQAVISLLKGGADVRFVTYRFPGVGNGDIESDAEELGISVIFCSGKQKSHVTEEIDWVPNIWIDDSPETVVSYKDMKGFIMGCEANKDLGSELTKKDLSKYKYYSSFKSTGKY